MNNILDDNQIIKDVIAYSHSERGATDRFFGLNKNIVVNPGMLVEIYDIDLHLFDLTEYIFENN